jgi:hypothetical protein
MTRNNYNFNENFEILTDDYWADIESGYDILFNFTTDGTIEGDFLAHEYAAEQQGLDYSLNDFETFEEIKNLYIQAVDDSTLSFKNSQIASNWNYISETAITIPTYFAWNVGNGDSFLLYLENQWREKNYNQDQINIGGFTNMNSKLDEHNEQYVSFSYKNKRGWTATLFYNRDNYKETTYVDGEKDIAKRSKNWNGVDFTVNLKSKVLNSRVLNILNQSLFGDSRISIFYGSQRGGLICANGVCAQQPEFSEGIKIGYIRMF